ncbi:hypothetical protein ACFFGT_03430 [Mucilaginibacter angelicae]|uniref:Uncharacterized protein n=1 Tax=Mucilaginibacter angelicae TaxID=869718 RepID=A0ABV6L0R7_9SPHI
MKPANRQTILNAAFKRTQNKKYVIVSEAWQSRSQRMSDLHSYKIATSFLLVIDMIFSVVLPMLVTTPISNRPYISSHCMVFLTP